MFEKIRRSYKEYGAMVFIAMVLNRLINKLSTNSRINYYRFYKQPISPQKARKSSYSFQLITQYRNELEAMPRPKYVLSGRFSQNVQCVLGLKGGELVSCAWFAKSRFIEDEVRCIYTLSENAVWDFDIFVFPEYRMSRLFLFTWNEASNRLYEQGIRNSYSRISAFNQNSIRAHEKLGATKVGSAIFFTLRSLQISFSNLSPYVNINISSKNQPIYSFD
jgi:hypothetical protein